jgi:hypothetical protein
MREANDIAYQVYTACIDSEIDEIAERISEICQVATDKGYTGKMQISGSSIYGWEAHNYETDTGICIWSDEPGHYYANLLEGELWAVEGEVCGLTVGACWEPETSAA